MKPTDMQVYITKSGLDGIEKCKENKGSDLHY
jgi:hypothetical protein